MNELEFLREMFQDTRLHIGIGVIAQLGLSPNNYTLRAKVTLLPENRDIIATCGFPGVRFMEPPQVNDLVLMAMVDGHPDECFVVKQICSEDDLIPLFARTGHTVAYGRKGKKIYLGSDTKVCIARPDIEPTEPLVLGNVMLSALQALANAFLNASEIGESAVGSVWLAPEIRLALTQFLAVYVSAPTTNVVSQISFTERGI